MIFLLFLLLIVIVIMIPIFAVSGVKVKQPVEIKQSDTLKVTQDRNTPIFDSFGRIRMSESIIIFESKQIHNNNPILWYEVAGNGATWTYSSDRASSSITTTAGVASVSRRQTFRYFDYSPGQSQLVMLSDIILRDVPSNAPGVAIYNGQFSETNGIFFVYANNTMNVGLRSSVTGSPVDILIPQRRWNFDRMDGTGPSGIIADWSKIQVYTFDYGWLGADGIRWSLVIGGIIYPIHIRESSNVDSSVYMSTPENPLRFEVITTAESPSITTEQICSSIVTEGGADKGNSGIVFSQPCTETHVIPDGNNDYILMAFKLVDGLNTTVVPADINVYNLSTTSSDNVTWKLYLNPTISGTLSYTTVSPSSVQYHEGPGTDPYNTASGGIVIASGLTTSTSKQVTGQGQSGIGILSQSLNQMGRDENGDSQTIVITATCIDAATSINMRASFSWREL